MTAFGGAWSGSRRLPFDGFPTNPVTPRGDKGSYTDKQKRQAEHIDEGFEDPGFSKKESESRAWATVNKEHGGGCGRPHRLREFPDRHRRCTGHCAGMSGTVATVGIGEMVGADRPGA